MTSRRPRPWVTERGVRAAVLLLRPGSRPLRSGGYRYSADPAGRWPLRSDRAADVLGDRAELAEAAGVRARRAPRTALRLDASSPVVEAGRRSRIRLGLTSTLKSCFST